MVRRCYDIRKERPNRTCDGEEMISIPGTNTVASVESIVLMHHAEPFFQHFWTRGFDDCTRNGRTADDTAQRPKNWKGLGFLVTSMDDG